MADYCVGDIGAVVEVLVTEHGGALDVSGAATKAVVIKKPSGAHVTWTAAFSTDGKDGLIRYTTTGASDLNEAGDWQGQVSLGGLGGWTGLSVTTFGFSVRAAL